MKTYNKIILLIVCLFISGCSQKKEIQDQIFISSIGVDFKDGKYQVYFQSMGFANLLHQEGSPPTEPPAILMGTSMGNTIREAFSTIQKSSPQPLYFGHVKSIMLSPEIIKSHLDEFLSFSHNAEYLRYTSWVYCVEDDLNAVMSSFGFFNKPPAYTFIFNPKDIQDSHTFVPDVTIQKIVQHYYEPVGSIIIPTLKINKNNWVESEKEKPIVNIDGAYLISSKKLKGWINKDDLQGYNWLNPDRGSVIYVSIGKNKRTLIKIVNPNYHIKVVNGIVPKYIINIKLPIYLEENLDSLTVKEIKSQAKKKVISDIKLTYQKGLKLNTDILNITDKSYRINNNWSVEEINHLTKKSIVDVKVKIRYENQGNNKVS